MQRTQQFSTFLYYWKNPKGWCVKGSRLYFRRFLKSGLCSSRRRRRGLLSRKAAGNRALKGRFHTKTLPWERYGYFYCQLPKFAIKQLKALLLSWQPAMPRIAEFTHAFCCRFLDSFPDTALVRCSLVIEVFHSSHVAWQKQWDVLYQKDQFFHRIW